MKAATKELVLEGLNRLRGDDYYRASIAFRGMNSMQMQMQHGESGLSRQQVLDAYKAEWDKVTAAIAEVEKL